MTPGLPVGINAQASGFQISDHATSAKPQEPTDSERELQEFQAQTGQRLAWVRDRVALLERELSAARLLEQALSTGLNVTEQPMETPNPASLRI